MKHISSCEIISLVKSIRSEMDYLSMLLDLLGVLILFVIAMGIRKIFMDSKSNFNINEIPEIEGQLIVLLTWTESFVFDVAGGSLTQNLVSAFRL